jgi:hypothetical protein
MGGYYVFISVVVTLLVVREVWLRARRKKESGPPDRPGRP